jgi:hypothetical protein
MRIAIVIRELAVARAKRPDVRTGRAWTLIHHPSPFIDGCFYLRLLRSALFDRRHLRPMAAPSGGGIQPNA